MRRRRRAAEHELDVGHRKLGPRLDEGMQSARHHGAGPAAEQISPHHADRHAIEAHLAMKRAGVRPGVGHIGAEMILQIAPDRQVGDHIDAEPAQMLRRADAREHQELRRVECAGGKDHFARRRRADRRAVLNVFDAGRARAFEDHARRVRVDRDGKVLAAALPV